MYTHCVYVCTLFAVPIWAEWYKENRRICERGGRQNMSWGPTAKRGPAARGRATTPVVRTEVLHFHTNQFTNNVSRRCFQELQTGGEEQVCQFHATGKSDEGLYAPNTIVNYQFKVKNVRFFPGSPPECDVTVHKSLACWGDRSKGVKRQRREIYRAVVLADDDEEDCEIRA